MGLFQHTPWLIITSFTYQLAPNLVSRALLLLVSQVEAIEYRKDDGSYDKPTKYDTLDPSKFKDTFEAPEKFDEAWNHEEPFQRRKWREGIHKELTKMHGKRVWNIAVENGSSTNSTERPSSELRTKKLNSEQTMTDDSEREEGIESYTLHTKQRTESSHRSINTHLPLQDCTTERDSVSSSQTG